MQFATAKAGIILVSQSWSRLLTITWTVWLINQTISQHFHHIYLLNDDNDNIHEPYNRINTFTYQSVPVKSLQSMCAFLLFIYICFIVCLSIRWLWTQRTSCWRWSLHCARLTFFYCNFYVIARPQKCYIIGPRLFTNPLCLSQVGCKAVVCPTQFRTQKYCEMLRKLCPEIETSSPMDIKSAR